MLTVDHAAVTAEAFDSINPELLDLANDIFLDNLSFRVVGLSTSGIAEIYNATEARYAGMQRKT